MKYITRDIVCLYNEVDKEEEIFIYIYIYIYLIIKKSEIWKCERRNCLKLKLFSLNS